MLSDLETASTEDPSLGCHGPITDVVAKLGNGDGYGWSSDYFHH